MVSEKVICLDYLADSGVSFDSVAEVLKVIEKGIAPASLVIVGAGVGVEAGLLEFLKQQGLNVRLVALNEFDEIRQQNGIAILRI